MRFNCIKNIIVGVLAFVLIVTTVPTVPVMANDYLNGTYYFQAQKQYYVHKDEMYWGTTMTDTVRQYDYLNNAFLVYYPEGYSLKGEGNIGSNDTFYYCLCCFDGDHFATPMGSYGSGNYTLAFVDKPIVYNQINNAKGEVIEVPVFVAYSVEYVSVYNQPVPYFDLKPKMVYSVKPFSLLATRGNLQLQTTVYTQTMDDYRHGGGGHSRVPHTNPDKEDDLNRVRQKLNDIKIKSVKVKDTNNLLHIIPLDVLQPNLDLSSGDVKVDFNTYNIGEYIGECTEITDISFDIDYDYDIYEDNSVTNYIETYTYNFDYSTTILEYNYTTNIENFETVNYISSDDDIINITVNEGANIVEKAPDEEPTTSGGGGNGSGGNGSGGGGTTDIALPDNVTDLTSQGITFFNGLMASTGDFFGFMGEVGSKIGGSTIGLLFAGAILVAIFCRILGR